MISRRLLPVRFASTVAGTAAQTAAANAGKESALNGASAAPVASAAAASAAAGVRRIQEMLSKNDFSGAAETVLGLSRKDLAPDAMRDLSRHQAQLVNHFAGLESGDLKGVLPTVWKLQSKFIELGRTSNVACAQIMLLALRVGEPERAIEVWVQLLESLAKRSRKAVKDIVSQPQMAGCALAALAAYFVSCSRRGVPVDGPTALKLVPLKQVPISLAPLNNLKGHAAALDKETLVIIREGLSALRQSLNDVSSPEYLALIAKANFRESQTLYEEALQHKELPEEVYAAFIRRFAETRQSEAAFKVWNTLVERFTAAGKSPTVVSWRALLRAGSLAPQSPKLMVDQLWSEMQKAGIEPDEDCWCVRLESLVRADKVDEAVKVFNEVRPKLGVYGFNVVITGLAKAKRFEEIDALIASADPETVKPNNVTYNALISAAVRSRNSALAHRYLDEMSQAKILPDIITYSQILHALFDAQRSNGVAIAEAVQSVLAEMKARKIAPNAQFYTILAHGIARSTESVGLSRRLFRIMQEAQMPLSVETFGALIDAELKHGDFARAKMYFDLMPKHGLPYAASNYNQLIAAALANNDLPTAESLLTAMTKRTRTQPNVYTYMFLLRNWQPADLEKPPVGDLVRRTMAQLAANLGVLDYALAQRVLLLASAADASEDLVAAAQRVSAEQYKSKVANHSRKN